MTVTRKVKTWVRCVGGSRLEEIEATATAVPGLCVHPTLCDDPRFEVAGFWTVTHQPSGTGVVIYLPNESLALLAAEWLGRKGGDWTRSKEAVQADPQTKRAAMELRATVQRQFDTICELLDDLSDEREAAPRCVLVQ